MDCQFGALIAVDGASDDRMHQVRAPALVSEFGWTDMGLEAVESLATTAAGTKAVVSVVSAQRVPAGAMHEYVVTKPRQSPPCLPFDGP